MLNMLRFENRYPSTQKRHTTEAGDFDATVLFSLLETLRTCLGLQPAPARVLVPVRVRKTLS